MNNFDKLDGLRDAYLLAFGDVNIADIFERESVKQLAEVRHVFVHQAGIADDDFVEKASGIPLLSVIGKGQRIPVDGAFVNDLIPPVVETAFDLIRSVDTWLTNNPQS